MINNHLEKIRDRLENEKALIEKELKNFAKEDEKLKGDWDTRFPYFDGEIGSGNLEKAAGEVEEYEAKLPLEHTLELRLRDVGLALKKIEKGKYGVCEKCKKPIEVERLSIYPEARMCLKCKKSKQ
jgi:DnaK suppressor protein